MSKTAAELMADLARDQEFQARKKAQDKHFISLKKLYSEDEKQLVEELCKAGYAVDSVWDLVNTETDYFGAEQILVKHLALTHHPKILAGIVRALAIPEFSNNDNLWLLLTGLYSNTQPDSEISIPEERGVQTAVAVALECLATEERIDSLIKLIAANPDADGVRWLREQIKRLD